MNVREIDKLVCEWSMENGIALTEHQLNSLVDKLSGAPDGNVHTMPSHGLKHIESVQCWCEPELTGDYANVGGVKHYSHKEVQ